MILIQAEYGLMIVVLVHQILNINVHCCFCKWIVTKTTLEFWCLYSVIGLAKLTNHGAHTSWENNQFSLWYSGIFQRSPPKKCLMNGDHWCVLMMWLLAKQCFTFHCFYPLLCLLRSMTKALSRYSFKTIVYFWIQNTDVVRWV